MRALVLPILLAGMLAAGVCGGADADQTLPGGFVVTRLPTPTDVVPGVGSPAGGTPITLTGTDFTAAATVPVGGAAAAGVQFVNRTTRTPPTPPGLGVGDVQVRTAGGSATEATDPGSSPRWNSGTVLGGARFLSGTSCRTTLCGGTTALVGRATATGVGRLVGILPLDVDAIAGTVR